MDLRTGLLGDVIMNRKLIALLALFGALAIVPVTANAESPSDNEIAAEGGNISPVGEEAWVCYAFNDAGREFTAHGRYKKNVRERVMDKCAQVSLNCHFDGCEITY
jgi:hypothetical protein